MEELVRILRQETDWARLRAAIDSVLSSSPLAGPPPAQLIAAAVASPLFPDDSILNLVRAWSRPEMSRAALDALRALSTEQERERVAWLLKAALAVEHSTEAINRVLDHSENVQLRRWLLEGLERLAAAGSLGWEQLDAVIDSLAGEHHPALLSALASLLGTLPWREANLSLLEPLLHHSDYEVVSAAASTLARHPNAALRLDRKWIDHLRVHSNPMMRHSGEILDQAIRRRSGTKTP
jgi:hypothetical protein